ncbi:head completion/stabilization protein [Providencia manganoxydans]|uniref:head completion/stabilization protein n=1 Tax=Providencia manganoxydans TaxID=2923283 RepID=UPI0034E5B859
MLNGNELNYHSVEITNDGFWPDINLEDFQKQRQVPADLNNDLLTDALLASVAEINLSLESLKKQLMSKGYSTASDAPGAKANGQNALCAQYKKALYARAKADLIGEYTSIVSRAANPKQETPEVRSRLLAEAAFVIRNMKGLKRVTVAMI